MISLFHATAHLNPARGPAFQTFLAEVRAIEEPGTYYSYPGLEAALHSAGY